LTYVIILFVVGVLLVFLETFIPSGGMLGFVAAASLVGAVILAFMQSGTIGWIILLIVLVCVPVLILLGLKVLPRTPFGRKLLLAANNEDSVGARGKGGISDEDFGPLKGKTGITITQLRPSGIAEIDGKRYSVISEGEVISQKSDIVVTKIEGNSIIVEPRRENAQG